MTLNAGGFSVEAVRRLGRIKASHGGTKVPLDHVILIP